MCRNTFETPETSIGASRGGLSVSGCGDPSELNGEYKGSLPLVLLRESRPGLACDNADRRLSLTYALLFLVALDCWLCTYGRMDGLVWYRAWGL